VIGIAEVPGLIHEQDRPLLRHEFLDVCRRRGFEVRGVRTAAERLARRIETVADDECAVPVEVVPEVLEGLLDVRAAVL
jgi:acetolactate synthase regulatory subunit